jgi:hypothetical protein
MTGTGTTIATNGITFNGLTDTTQFDELGRTLEIYGTSSVTSSYQGSLYFETGANLVVESGATFNTSQLAIQGSDISGQTTGGDWTQPQSTESQLAGVMPLLNYVEGDKGI